MNTDPHAAAALNAVREWQGMDRRSVSRQAQDATMSGMRNRVPVRAAHMVARVFTVLVHIKRDPGLGADAMRFYVDSLWCDGAPDYQGLSVKALEAGQFETTWRILSRGREVSHRPQLAYQAALFARNWLLSGRSSKRLYDLGRYLSNY